MSARAKNIVALLGAGGHARAVVEVARSSGLAPDVYVDRQPCEWLASLPRYESDEALLDAVGDSPGTLLAGLGGSDPGALCNRLALLERYLSRGWSAPAIVHPRAWLSETSVIEDAVIVLAGAVLQPCARVGLGGIVNTGAIVEHDARVGAGAHIAPGAVVLGGVTVGRCAMVGAGSVLLPGARLADGALARAAERYPR